jgi:hypothetical protein
MAKEKFEDRRLTGTINVACKYDDGNVRYWAADKAEVVAHIVSIVNTYSRKGYVLTLRQLHYQLVSRNWIINHDTAYKKLGSILDDCRYAGVIDWSAIEDRGRVPYLPYYADDAAEAVEDITASFRINRQEGQTNYVELWTEKDALSGILKRTTEKYHVQLVVNKGYTSSSAIYGAYERVVERILNGQKVTILYFGDHDPSGLDMIRDIRDRLRFFLSRGDTLRANERFNSLVEDWWINSGNDIYGLVSMKFCEESVLKLMNDDDNEGLFDDFNAGKVAYYLFYNELFTVRAIGLTMDQIEEHLLPPNPTKMTDSRAANYVKEFGRTCWEVDALNPETLTEIVEYNITQQINMDVYQNALDREAMEKQKLIDFKNQL